MNTLILVLVALLAGAASAISPCVLPVLPIVLGGSVAGGRQRPLGIVIGVVGSFVLFTLTLTSALRAIGISATAMRNGAIVVLALFGLALLIPPAEAVLTRLLAPLGTLGGRASDRVAEREGLVGGLLLGAALGLVWTPCAGPVLTAVTASVAAGSSWFESGLVLLSYAVGAAVPLLLIGSVGRRAVAKLGSAAGRVRPAMGALMIVAAGLMFAGVDTRLAASTGGGGYVQALQSVERSTRLSGPLSSLRGYGPRATPKPSNDPTPATAAASALPNLGPAPEIQGISAWFNTPGGRPLPLSELRGRVVLVDFWTYSCVNCLRTLPHLKALDRAYRNKGLTIVGVHTPEFAFEAEPNNVRDAIKRLGVTWPVALDPKFATFRAFQNQYWPAEYLIDQEGNVRNLKVGEGDYDKTESEVRDLLHLDAAGQVDRNVIDETPRERGLTPESYLGAERLDRFVSPEGVVRDRPQRYSVPLAMASNQLAYQGVVTIEPQRISAGAGASIQLRFRATKVYLVLDSPGGPTTARILIDGHEATAANAGGDVGPGGALPIRASRLYQLASIPGAAQEHRLSVELPPGTRAYAFTFG